MISILGCDADLSTQDHIGDVRASCVRNVLVYYCRDYQSSHHIAISADRWPDHLPLSDDRTGFRLQRLRQARRRWQAAV
jgi:hypothetical protein